MKGMHIGGDYSLTKRPTNEMAGFAESNWGSAFVVNSVPMNGLRAWFDPNVNITLSGTDVSTWADITGTYYLRQTSGSLTPLYNTGARPSITFSTGDYFLSDTVPFGIGANSAITIIAIWQQTTFGGAKQFFAFNCANATSCDSGGYTFNASSSSATNYSVGYPPTVNTTGAYGQANTGMTSLEVNRTDALTYFSVNSLFHKSSVAITYTTADAWINGTLWIGRARDNSGSAFTGTLWDILIYNRALTKAEYISMFNFFKAKYGLTN